MLRNPGNWSSAPPRAHGGKSRADLAGLARHHGPSGFNCAEGLPSPGAGMRIISRCGIFCHGRERPQKEMRNEGYTVGNRSDAVSLRVFACPSSRRSQSEQSNGAPAEPGRTSAVRDAPSLECRRQERMHGAQGKTLNLLPAEAIARPCRRAPAGQATKLITGHRMTDDQQNQNPRGPLFALAAVVVIFVLGLVVFRTLYTSRRLEDCFLSGRTNCAPIESPTQ
jgi:hypothetical protein